MKNGWDVWGWCCFIAMCAVAIVEIMYFTGMFILKQETNVVNIELRKQFIGVFQFQVSQVMTIIGMVVAYKYKKDDKL